MTYSIPMRVMLLIFLFFLNFNALGWSERGNGGNSIICNDSAKNKFYDTYEAEYRYNLKPDYPFSHRECYDDTSCFNLSLTIARELINRIPDYNLHFKEFMLAKLRRFGTEAAFLDDIELLPIDDMGIAFIPKGCSLHQTVIQKNPHFPDDKRYIISNDLWRKLTPQHQAVGIIHELLYYYAGVITRPPENSESIRYLNAFIISGEISNLSEAEFTKLHMRVFTKASSKND